DPRVGGRVERRFEVDDPGVPAEPRVPDRDVPLFADRDLLLAARVVDVLVDRAEPAEDRPRELLDDAGGADATLTAPEVPEVHRAPLELRERPRIPDPV